MRLAARNRFALTLPVLQAVAGGDHVVLADQAQIVAGHDEDLLFELVLALVAVDRALRRVDAHVAGRFQQINLTAAALGEQGPFVFGLLFTLTVVGGQLVGQHLDVAARRAGVAAGDVGLVIAVPFDAFLGIDLQRLVAFAQIRRCGLAEGRAGRQDHERGSRGGQQESAGCHQGLWWRGGSRGCGHCAVSSDEVFRAAPGSALLAWGRAPSASG